MKAFQEGGYVIIEISDDGGGLNTDKIRDRALQRGLISRDRAQAMSESEVHRLIFAPGFSTADAVTNLSGRGVGMDVVKSSVEKIGGQVDIASRAGAGSTIRLKIPLTLAIIPALLLSCGGQTFAVPQSAVMELVRLDASDESSALAWIGTLPFYQLRGDLLPLLFLSNQLTLQQVGDAPKEGIIVVVDIDGCRFGVVVDAVYDTEEVVVKPLGRQLGSLAAYAGATILGDGRIALILDPAVLAQQAQVQQREVTMNSPQAQAVTTTSCSDIGRLLVIQLTPDLRAAIPLDCVRRLEEVSPQKIERVGSRSVIQYRGGILPLVDVASTLNRGGERWSNGRVVVVGQEDSLVGLQVEAILDVTNELGAVRPAQGDAGIQCYGVIQGKVIALLDIDYVLSAAGLQREVSGKHEQVQL